MLQRGVSFAQRQSVIMCIPKPEKDRRFIKNWRPTILLNVLYKMASTCTASRMKKVLNKLVSKEQIGFIPGRCTGNNIRLIYDIIKITKEQNIPGLLLVVDFEKAFDSISREYIT